MYKSYLWIQYLSYHFIAWECMTLQKPRTSWNVLEWWRSARCLVSKPFRTHSATCFSPISFSLLRSVVLTLSVPLLPRDAEISLYCLGDKLVLPCFSLALPRWLGSFGRGAFCRFQSLAGQLWCIWSIKRRLPKRKGKVYKWKTTMCVSFATCKCYFLGLCSFNLCILLHHSPLQLTFHVCFHLSRTCNAWRNALKRCLSPWSNVNRTCCTATVTSGRGQHSPNIQIDEKAKQLRLINWSRHIKTANFGKKPMWDKVTCSWCLCARTSPCIEHVSTLCQRPIWMQKRKKLSGSRSCVVFEECFRSKTEK